MERRRRGDGQSLEKKKEEEKKGKKIGEKKYFSFSNRLRYKVQKKKKIYIYIEKEGRKIHRSTSNRSNFINNTFSSNARKNFGIKRILLRVWK